MAGHRRNRSNCPAVGGSEAGGVSRASEVLQDGALSVVLSAVSSFGRAKVGVLGPVPVRDGDALVFAVVAVRVDGRPDRVLVLKQVLAVPGEESRGSVSVVLVGQVSVGLHDQVVNSLLLQLVNSLDIESLLGDRHVAVVLPDAHAFAHGLLAGPSSALEVGLQLAVGTTSIAINAVFVVALLGSGLDSVTAVRSWGGSADTGGENVARAAPSGLDRAGVGASILSGKVAVIACLGGNDMAITAICRARALNRLLSRATSSAAVLGLLLDVLGLLLEALVLSGVEGAHSNVFPLIKLAVDRRL